jgi:hypothetical protein
VAERLAPWRPAIVLFAVSFALWLLGMHLHGGRSPLWHSPVDQHTQQALSWLHGRIDLDEQSDEMEIAQYRGRLFNSFPPTPTLVELPFAMAFGRRTPSSLVLYAFWYLALLSQYCVLRRRGFSEAGAIAAPLAFLFATNVYVSCIHANVWAQGQSLGYCLALIGLAFVVANPRGGLLGPGLGYAALSLAVGCRPFYLFMAPLFVAIDNSTNGRGLRSCAASATLWMLPYGLLLAAYNAVRFGNPLEFGHRYLPWPERLPHGMFSLHYVPWNAYHAFLRLPIWSSRWPNLRFDVFGTAFWLNNAPLVIGIVALATARLEPEIRWTAAFALVSTGLGVLMYESAGSRLLPPGLVVAGAGNHQFGFRYFIDLLPTAFTAFAFARRRFTPMMVAASLVSFALNLYGLAYWREARFEPDVRAAAATQALDQAHWKLKPPIRPSTSRISPTRWRPGHLRDSRVPGSTSVNGTPPAVTSA